MKIVQEKQEQNVVRLNLELDSEKAKRAYDQTCRQLSHRVNIPGFRKGKAPQGIVEQTLGVDYIKREALQHMIPELLTEAIITEKLDVIAQPEISSCEFELGSPLKLQAKVEVRPEVTLGKYRGVKAEVAKAELPANAVDQALQNIADSQAQLSEATSRPIKLGDTAVLDFECYVENKLVDGGKAQGLILEIKEGNFLPGFCEQLIGKEPGSSCEIKATFPDNYRNTAVAGKEGNFKVQITGIREKKIPEINDELAKLVGQESLASLRAYISERLEEEIQQETAIRTQKAVIDAVIKTSSVEVPESMVEREHSLLLNQIHSLVEQNKQSWTEFQKTPEFAQIKEAKLGEARQRVLTSLVLGAVVRAEKVDVAPEELGLHLQELANRYNVPTEEISGNEETKRQLTEELLISKVVNLLVNSAEVKYTAEEAPTKTGAAEETTLKQKA